MLYWIPIAIIYYIIYAMFSKYANDYDSLKYTIALFFLQAFGLWPIVARYSDNLIRDGLLFDFVIIITFYGTMLIMGCGRNFSVAQWVGTITALVGILMIKVGQ